MDRYEGRCHCGRVRFLLDGAPMQSLFCHCSICRLSTGAPYAMVGFWEVGRTRIAEGGPLLERPTSGWLTRHRCPDCGAAIFNSVRSDELTSNNFMLPLLVERDRLVMPTHHIYYADRVVDVADDLPRFDRFEWLSS
jgi:hypothetical protein